MVRSQEKVDFLLLSGLENLIAGWKNIRAHFDPLVKREVISGGPLHGIPVFATTAIHMTEYAYKNRTNIGDDVITSKTFTCLQPTLQHFILSTPAVTGVILKFNLTSSNNFTSTFNTIALKSFSLLQ